MRFLISCSVMIHSFCHRWRRLALFYTVYYTVFHVKSQVQRKSAPFWGAFQGFSAKALGNADECDAVKVYPISPVGVEKAVAVRIGTEIEGKRPRAPEKIDVAVADAAVSKIDKAAELPVVQKDVRQTIIAV